MRKATDLLVAIALALVALALTLLGPEHGAARALAAAMLVLVLPGFAVTAATFPRSTLSTTERVLLSTGLSLAIAALGGLLLNWTLGGLQTLTWGVLLVAITVIGCGVAFFRRVSGAPSVERHGLELGWRQAAVFGLAGVIVAVALGFSAQGVLNQPSEGFTQLWLLPTDANTTSVRVGVSNQDQSPISYVLKVESDGRSIKEWPVDLQPGRSWEQTLTLPADLPATARIEAQLFRPDVAGIYRQAWIDRGKR